MSSTTSAAPSGRDFASTFESGPDSAGGLRRGGASDRLRDQLVREARQHMQNIGWQSATVINLHLFPLVLNLGELGQIEVPACPADGPFASLTLDACRISMRDLGEGNFHPVPVLPIELAREFEREYAPTGGVFILAGKNTQPSDAQLASARDRLRLWYRREFQAATDAWTRYRQHKFITERQRDAARELHRLGEIPALPEWVAISQPGNQLRPCPACGEDVKSDARICRHCRYRIDPKWLKKLGDFVEPAPPAPRLDLRGRPDAPDLETQSAAAATPETHKVPENSTS